MNELIAEINEQPWAILPSALNNLVAKIKAGNVPEAARESQTHQAGNVAVIPVHGPIMSGDSLLTRYFGFPSSARIAKTVQALAGDQSCGCIVLDMDTPGGTVAGVQEAAEAIASVRGTKKVVAISNHLMASAGYWIGSAADDVVASPSSLTGSIGVISTHYSLAGAMEQAGIEVTILTAGKYKAEGNQFEPLDDEARESMQGVIDSYYDDFTKGVAKNRGVNVSTVKSDFGQGRVLTAKDAKASGLVDRIESFDQLLARLTSSKRAQSSRRSMEAELALIEAINEGERA